MKKYICDRCKTELDKEKDLREILFLGLRSHGMKSNFELCEKCRDHIYLTIVLEIDPPKPL